MRGNDRYQQKERMEDEIIERIDMPVRRRIKASKELEIYLRVPIGELMVHDTEQCRVLWMAVLRQAMEDALSFRTDLCIAEEARLWFKNCRNCGIGSFLWVCDALDLEPDAIRKWLIDNGNYA